jgi:hypothetical protein
VPAPDRRTIGELLADSDALARETLLDARPDMSESDPMEGLRLVGEAIARSVRAGHWPGHGPSDDHLTEIADNLSRARHLVERDGRTSGPATADRQADTPDIHGQVMHTLYVAAHGTAVALGGYVTELQHRLEVGTRRRQPMAERPTTLEITEAQAMIARFSGFEQPWLLGRFKRTARWPPTRIRPTWCGSPVCRHSSLAPRASSPKPPPQGAISTTM